MSNYTKSTNFAAKDALASGNPAKIVRGTEIDSEFSNIATAIATKADAANAALTGTPTAPTAAVSTDSTQIATTAFVRDVMTTYNVIQGTAKSLTGTAVEFTSISADAKKISIPVSAMSTNGTSPPIIQLGDSGGYEVSNYFCTGSVFPNSAVTQNTSYTAGFGIASANASNVLYGRIDLELIDSATNLWAFSCIFAVPGGPALCVSAGTKALSGTLDRVRFTTLSGTDSYDGGTANIQVHT